VIEYVTGDATCPIGDGTKIIAHIVNNAGVWGAGFVMALSAKWPEPEEAYRQWAKSGRLTLGRIQLEEIESQPDIIVANMCAQDNRSGVHPPVRYDALRRCLSTLEDCAMQMAASVHMPRIGCGIGGGRWEAVEPIIREELGDLRVVVYDLP
jgi:O-acetyl-ADP-ribose deacetylase (regulator of RNase III)